MNENFLFIVVGLYEAFLLHNMLMKKTTFSRLCHFRKMPRFGFDLTFFEKAEVWIRPLVGLKMITIHIRPHVFLKNLRFELDLLSA